MTGGLPGVALGNSNIVAVNLTTFNFSPNPTGQPDRFDNSPYRLNVTLTDISSHATRTLNFRGLFNGTLSNTSANITATFTSPTTQSTMLGQNLYTVHLTSYTAQVRPQPVTREPSAIM